MVRSPPRVKVPDAWAGAWVVTPPTVRPPPKTGYAAWQAGPVDLHTIAQMPFTYPEVGATAGPMPPGYKHIGYSAHIGMGQLRFEQAADAVMHWGMQRGSGL